MPRGSDSLGRSRYQMSRYHGVMTGIPCPFSANGPRHRASLSGGWRHLSGVKAESSPELIILFLVLYLFGLATDSNRYLHYQEE